MRIPAIVIRPVPALEQIRVYVQHGDTVTEHIVSHGRAAALAQLMVAMLATIEADRYAASA